MQGSPLGVQRYRVPIKNAEATSTIPVGTPVSLNVSGTDDGFGVVLPSSSALKATAFHYGASLYTLLPGQIGESIVSGFIQKMVVLLQTRAASTDNWSASTLSLGCMLNVDTINNAYSTSGGTLAKSSFVPVAVLGQSSAAASSASATSDTRTAVTGYMKGFIRAL